MGGGLRLLKKHCEYPTLSNAAGRDGFAVLVHAKAPAASAAEAASSRAPLDLGSMMGEKLAPVKQAMGFVIDNLDADDRLSVVAFDSYTCRLPSHPPRRLDKIMGRSRPSAPWRPSSRADAR
jgi:hypothetical protein